MKPCKKRHRKTLIKTLRRNIGIDTIAKLTVRFVAEPSVLSVCQNLDQQIGELTLHVQLNLEEGTTAISEGLQQSYEEDNNDLSE
jgi:hypothetical protein